MSANTMESTNQSDLVRVIEQQYGCSATFVRTESVALEGQADWDGNISVFSVDHAEADTCFAWSMPIEGSGQRWAVDGLDLPGFFAVLKKSPVDSPEAAVRSLREAMDERQWAIHPVKADSST